MTPSHASLDREIQDLVRRLQETPGDRDRTLELVRLLTRAGEWVRAHAWLDRLHDAQPDAELEELLRNNLALGSYRSVFHPEPLPSPDTGKPRTRHAITALAFDPAEEHLAVAKGSGDLYLLSLDASSEPRYLGKTAKKKGAEALCFLADGSAFLSGGSDGYLRRWDLADGRMTRVSKKLGTPVESLVVRGGDVAAGGLGGRYLARSGGVATLEPALTRQVSWKALLDPEGDGPLEDLQRERFGDRAGEADFVHRYYSDQKVVYETGGRALAMLRDGRLDLYRGGAWELHRGPRWVRTRFLDLAPLGRALAIGACHRVVQQHPLDPPSRGLRLVLLEGEPVFHDLLEEDFVSAVAFSPSGRQLAVGTRTGHLFRIPLFQELPRPLGPAAEERPEGGDNLSPPWETRGTPILRSDRVAVLGRYPGEGGFRRTRGVEFLFADDVLITLATRCPEGRSPLEPICLSLKSGTFEPSERAWRGGNYPRPRRIEGERSRELASAVGAPLRRWVLSPDESLAAVLVRGEPEVVWLVSRRSTRAPTRMVCAAPIEKLAWSPRGTRLALLLRGGGVEILGSP